MKTKTFDVELRPIDAIRPYEGNPRVNDQAVDAVAASLREFGFRQPIVVDGDGVIIVPREHAAAVAVAARRVLESDMASRRALYERLGLPLDRTVVPDSSGGRRR